MKVNRYLYGRTNIGQLESGRAALRSPAEVAAEAAAPFDAGAQIAGATSDVLNRLAQDRRDAQNEEDQAQAELNFSLAEGAREEAINEAKLKNWPADKFDETMRQIDQNLTDSVSVISDLNSEEYSEKVQNYNMLSGMKNSSVSNEIRHTQAIQKTDDSVNVAMKGRNFILAENITRTAMKDGRYTQEQGDKQLRSISLRKEGYKLADAYKLAVNNGTANEFMANMATEVFDPETLAVFDDEKNRYDQQMKGIKEEEAKRAMEIRDAGITVYRTNIDFAPLENDEDLENFLASYSNENLNAYATANDMSLGERQSLFNKRNTRLKELMSRGNKEQGGIVEPELLSKTYRNSISKIAASELGVNPDTATPEQRQAVIDWEMRNAQDQGALGQNATNFLNNAAMGASPNTSTDESWQQFLVGLSYYEKLDAMDNVALNGIVDDASSMYQSMISMDFKSNPDLAKKVWSNSRSMNQDQRDEANRYFDLEALLGVISDDENLLDKAGIVIADDFLWFNNKPVITGAIRAQINRIGRTVGVAQYGTFKDINYATLADSVAGVLGKQITASTLNRGVPTGGAMILSSTGDLEDIGVMDSEAMLHAPTNREGEVWVRGRLKEDFVDFPNEPMVVKAYGEEFTIVQPVLTDISRTEAMDIYEAKGDILPPMMDLEAFGLEYGDEGNVIPVNHIRIVTPALPQDQFDAAGDPIWHLYYRDKLLLNAKDVMDETGRVILAKDQPYEWSPFDKDPENMAKAMQP